MTRLLHYFELNSIKKKIMHLFAKRGMLNVLNEFCVVGYEPLNAPLTVNEKLKKEDERKKVDETHFKILVGNILECWDIDNAY